MAFNLCYQADLFKDNCSAGSQAGVSSGTGGNNTHVRATEFPEAHAQFKKCRSRHSIVGVRHCCGSRPGAPFQWCYEHLNWRTPPRHRRVSYAYRPGVGELRLSGARISRRDQLPVLSSRHQGCPPGNGLRSLQLEHHHANHPKRRPPGRNRRCGMQHVCASDQWCLGRHGAEEGGGISCSADVHASPERAANFAQTTGEHQSGATICAGRPTATRPVMGISEKPSTK